jgi:MYXO-CTERM domain-containing protein
VRVLLAGLLLSNSLVHAQVLFREDFEGVVGRVDAGGVWTEIYDVVASRQLLPEAAHAGALGLRVSRSMSFGTGADTQFEWVSPLRQGGEVWARWWMRLNPTQPGQQQVMNFGDTTVPNHVGLVLNGPNQLVTGYRGNGQFFALPAGPIADAGWQLYELGVFGMGSRDGGVALLVNGTSASASTMDFSFPDAGFFQLNIGLTFGNPNAFRGSIDYDDVRVSRRRPEGALQVSGEMQPWYVGECALVRVGLSTSDRALGVAAQTSVSFTFTPPLTAFADPMCAAPATLTIPTGQTSLPVYVRPMAPGPFDLEVTSPDLFLARARVTVLPPFDAGQPDAGEADGGVQDAGILDAGMPDGGLSDDGGTEDAGFDASVADAGVLLDAGAPVDASVGDAGVEPADAGDFMPPPDAGQGEVALSVGCGCTTPGAGGIALSLLAALGRRRRSTAHRAPTRP